MQSKVIFFVLIMLSFTVLHDTVINIMDADNHTHTVYHTDDNIHSQESQNESFDVIHDMLHFVALVTPYKNSFIQLPTKQNLSYNSHTHTFTYKETTDKPPQA